MMGKVFAEEGLTFQENVLMTGKTQCQGEVYVLHSLGPHQYTMFSFINIHSAF